jgi:anti-sigma factor RsiW
MRFRRRRDELACRDAVALMNDYLDGALDPRARSGLEAHLAGCPHCTEYLAQLRASIALTGRTAAPEPDAATDRALAELYRSWRATPPDS